jgi:hypothetical protein
MSNAPLRIHEPNNIHCIPFRELSRDFCENLLDYHAKFTIWTHPDEVRVVSSTMSVLNICLLSMFQLARQDLDGDIIQERTTDPRILEIKAQIALLREKSVYIGRNPTALADFDTRMDREQRAYQDLRTILQVQQRRH